MAEGTLEINLSNRAFVTQVLLDINKRYNRKKEHLYKRTQMYFNQSIGSNYVMEDQLRDMIAECESIKQEYREFKARVDAFNSQEKRVV